MSEPVPAPVAGRSRTGTDLPELPEHVATAARQVPDHWITVVDPAWRDDDDGGPPSWALVGAWRTDERGEVVEWRDNDQHRPSPAALDWPAPTDQLDMLAQRVATGWAPVDALVGVLVHSDVLVLLDVHGTPASVAGPDGTACVAVYSSPAQAARAALGTRMLPVPRLLDQLPADHALLLNPGGTAVLCLDAEPVRARLAADA